VGRNETSRAEGHILMSACCTLPGEYFILLFRGAGWIGAIQWRREGNQSRVGGAPNDFRRGACIFSGRGWQTCPDNHGESQRLPVAHVSSYAMYTPSRIIIRSVDYQRLLKPYQSGKVGMARQMNQSCRFFRNWAAKSVGDLGGLQVYMALSCDRYGYFRDVLYRTNSLEARMN
jgi:hypothetical protein